MPTNKGTSPPTDSTELTGADVPIPRKAILGLLEDLQEKLDQERQKMGETKEGDLKAHHRHFGKVLAYARAIDLVQKIMWETLPDSDGT